METTKVTCAGVLLVLLTSAAIPFCEVAEAASQLRNEHLTVRLSERGGLERIENLVSAEDYWIEEDTFAVVTDYGVFSNDSATAVRREVDSKVARYTFSNGNLFDVVLEYMLEPEYRYIRRRILLTHLQVPLTLLQIDLGRTVFKNPPGEIVKYDTFWNAPTVNFLRWKSGGLFVGIENPFFEVSSPTGGIALSYEPSLMLNPGDTYESEPQFWGVYRKSGYRIKQQIPRTRLVENGVYRPRYRNPSGHVPLDREEVRAMRNFAAEYLDLQVDQFLFILYNFWNPLPQLPATEAEELLYHRMIDNFHELGGDLIIFNPLVQARVPTEDPDSYWEFAPPGSAAERILNHAAEKGIRYGFYSGMAAQMEHGNAAALPFGRYRKDWKKVDMIGTVGPENCMGSDEYTEWFLTVQRNTIAHYNLNLWSWDPGPGNAFFCYSTKHGHLPGRGDYKGWRNSTMIKRRLKEEFPGLYYQGFYGRKEYGLWGQKYTDQHEGYWEQYWLDVRNIFPDLYPDRINADGSRFQAWWSDVFRFLPSVMNHGLAHRMNQLYFHDPNYRKVWDHRGWRYGIMSALATAGSITAPILPDTLEDVPSLVSFYRKWLNWGRQNFDYVKYNTPFGDQVRIGGVDGYARIRDDHGFIFLANPGPRPTRTSFQLNEEIGLDAGGLFTLRELYPVEGSYHFDDTNRRGIYASSDAVAVLVPPHQVKLLELSRFRKEQLPLLFGSNGQVIRQGAEYRITGLEAEQGSTVRLVIATGGETTNASVRINGHAVPSVSEKEYLLSDVRFSGRSLLRYLDNWKTPEGETFEFPYHRAYESLSITTVFFADPVIRSLLEAARPGNLREIEPLIEKWKSEGSLDTFVWARPDRLILAVPFVEADRVGSVSMTLNGRDVPLDCYEIYGGFGGGRSKIAYYADLTDRVAWGEENTISFHLVELEDNQFLGPYFEYPSAPTTSKVEKGELVAQPPVVYDRPVRQERLILRSPGPGDRAPLIVSAWMEPETIRENEEVTFIATANLPAEELHGVFLSTVVGRGSRPEHALEYDPGTGRWSVKLKLGERVSMILDCRYSYIWAVARNGLVGEARKVPMSWFFSTQE